MFLWCFKINMKKDINNEEKWDINSKEFKEYVDKIRQQLQEEKRRATLQSDLQLKSEIEMINFNDLEKFTRNDTIIINKINEIILHLNDVMDNIDRISKNQLNLLTR